MRKNKLVILAVGILFCLSCSKSDVGPELQDRSPEIVMLCSPYGLGDVIYEDQILAAVDRIALENGIRTYTFSHKERNIGISMLTEYMDRCKGDGIRRLYLVFSPMVSLSSSLVRILEHIPDDGTADVLYLGPRHENVPEKIHAAEICPYGMYYSAGAIVARTFGNREDAFSFDFDEDDPYLIQAAVGFYAGAKSIYAYEIPYNAFTSKYDEEIDYSNSYFDMNSYTRNWGGFDFMMHMVKSVFKAQIINNPQGITDYYTAGMDIDCSMYSDRIMFSCVRHMDRLMDLCIGQWLSPEGLPFTQRFGLDSEYAEIIFSKGYEYLKPLADSIYEEAVRQEKEWTYRFGVGFLEQ